MSALTTCLCMEVTSCADNMKKAQWYGGVFLHGVWAYPVNSQIILLCEKKTININTNENIKICTVLKKL